MEHERRWRRRERDVLSTAHGQHSRRRAVADARPGRDIRREGVSACWAGQIRSRGEWRRAACARASDDSAAHGADRGYNVAAGDDSESLLNLGSSLSMSAGSANPWMPANFPPRSRTINPPSGMIVTRQNGGYILASGSEQPPQ
jgi:hypothetical protein